MIRVVHPGSGSCFFSYPGSWIQDSDPTLPVYIFSQGLYSDKGIQNSEGGAFEKFKTCRGSYIGLDLSMHVNKVPIHLMTESLYHLLLTSVATLTGCSNHRTQLIRLFDLKSSVVVVTSEYGAFMRPLSFRNFQKTSMRHI